MSDRPQNTIVGHVRNGFISRMMHYSPPSIVVWLALANRANKGGLSFPSVDNLMEDTGLARHTIVKAIRELEAGGEIEVERKDGIGSRYTILTSSRGALVHGAHRTSSGNAPDQFTARTGPVHGAHSNQTKEPNARTKRKNQTQRGKAAAGDVLLPTELDSDGFPAAWGRWLTYRRDRRLTCTPATLQGQLAKLTLLGPAAAAAEIDNSIGNGWQSVCYKPGAHNGNGKPRFAVGPGQRHPSAAGKPGVF